MEGLKAQDLRIGNYVLYEATYHKITSLTENVCGSVWLKAKEIDPYLHSYKEIQPIPLTSEWLIKFGFEEGVIKLNDSWHYLKLDLKTDCIDNCVFGEKRSSMSILYKIYYVHQLQNLYYALTGKELVMDN